MKIRKSKNKELGMGTMILLLLVLILVSLAFGFYSLVKAQGRMLLRLDQLEQQATTTAKPALPARSGTPAEEAESEGELVGTEFPAFAFPDLTGKTVALQDFHGKRVLLVNWNFNCGFCDSIAPDLAALQAGFEKGNIALVLLARGDAATNRKGAAEHGLHCPILMREDGEPPAPFRHRGTPVAYLLDEESRIDAPFASGANEVVGLARALIEVETGAAESAKSEAQQPQNSQALVQPAGPHRVRLPGFMLKGELGLGDAIKGFTSAIGIKPCVGCERRAALLNRRLGFSGATGNGLRAGDRAPLFELRDLEGRTVSLEDYRGRRVLLVFTDPQCGPCDELAPDLVRLHQEHANNNLSVILVGRGDAEANRRKAQQHGFEFPVALQSKWNVSKEYGTFATPAAFLIAENGMIAKGAAIGRDPILALIPAM
jgi:peroxiredoxin